MGRMPAPVSDERDFHYTMKHRLCRTELRRSLSRAAAGWHSCRARKASAKLRRSSRSLQPGPFLVDRCERKIPANAAQEGAIEPFPREASDGIAPLDRKHTRSKRQDWLSSVLAS